MTEGIKLFQEVAKRFSVRYYLNLVLVDEEDRRYFKQQVSRSAIIFSGDRFAYKSDW